MKIKKSAAALAASSLLLVSACGGGSGGGEFPSRNIDVIVPFEAGGNADTQARAVTPCLEEQLGTRMIVENKPGSGGSLGTRELANAEPDGYTLSVNSVSPYVLGPLVVDNAGYDMDALQSFGYITASPIVFFVAQDSDIDDLGELIERSQAGGVTASVPGSNTLQDLLVKTLNENYEAEMSIVPTDSMSEIIRGVNAGDYDVGVTSLSLDLLPRIESGEVNVIVRGGSDDYEYLEGIPTYQEAGFDDLLPSTEITVPLAAPAGVPDEVAQEIEGALEGCLAEESVVEGLGAEMLPPEFVDGATSMSEYSDLSAAIQEVVQ